MQNQYSTRKITYNIYENILWKYSMQNRRIPCRIYVQERKLQIIFMKIFLLTIFQYRINTLQENYIYMNQISENILCRINILQRKKII